MYVSSRKAQEYFNVSCETLRQWQVHGKVEAKFTAGGHRRYKIIPRDDDKTKHKKIIYARVSSSKQRDDLKRQIAFVKAKYPSHEVISDVGSGINFKRKGFQALLGQIFEGNVIEVVVAHKDRISRFSFDFFKYVCFKYGVVLKIMSDKSNSPSEELSEDLIAILTHFTAKFNGSRKYYVLPKDKTSTEQDPEEHVK